jgi:hypothetical protein
MQKSKTSSFVPKVRKGQLFTCYYSFRESADFSRTSAHVGATYKLACKTTFKTQKGEPCYFLVARTYKKTGVRLYPSIVIPVSKFVSHFVPANCK